MSYNLPIKHAYMHRDPHLEMVDPVATGFCCLVMFLILKEHSNEVEFYIYFYIFQHWCIHSACVSLSFNLFQLTFNKTGPH